MIKTLVLFFVFVLLSAITFAQHYPLVIKPGENLNLSAEKDTLWILRNRQMNQAIIKASKLKTCLNKNLLLDSLITKKDTLISKKDIINAQLRKGYERYRDKWEETDKALEKERKENIKLKGRLKKTAVFSGASGILLTSILFILL